MKVKEEPNTPKYLWKLKRSAEWGYFELWSSFTRKQQLRCGTAEFNDPEMSNNLHMTVVCWCVSSTADVARNSTSDDNTALMYTRNWTSLKRSTRGFRRSRIRALNSSNGVREPIYSHGRCKLFYAETFKLELYLETLIHAFFVCHCTRFIVNSSDILLPSTATENQAENASILGG